MTLPLGALVLVSCGWAAQQPEAAARPLADARALEGEAAPILRELEALTRRHDALLARYREVDELKEVEAEREELRRRLKEEGARLRRLFDTKSGVLFANVLNEMQRARVERKGLEHETARVAAAALRGRLAGLETKLGSSFAGYKAGRKVVSVVYDVGQRLKRDEAEFDDAVLALQKRRVHRKLALLAAAVSSAALVAAVAWRARRPRALPGSDSGSPSSVHIPAGREAACRPASDTVRPGRILGGNFQVVREIGRGGMGVVYEAVDTTLQRKVAIKQMRDELCQGPGELEQFLAEARVVADLRHPNIVEIHGVLREGDRVFLVFEHVSGRVLGRLVEEERLALEPAKRVLGQAASALDYAHSRRVIHRDLKPSNIMIGEDGTVKIMDFGLAHRAKLSVARLSRAQAQGTPAYMAPEQELGSVCRESDIYALGVCLYEMATGTLPFPGPNFLAQKQELVYVRPSRAARLPAAFDAVIDRALQPEPSRRFHSAGELSAALAAVAEGSA